MIPALLFTGPHGQAMRFLCELAVPHTGQDSLLPPLVPHRPPVLPLGTRFKWKAVRSTNATHTPLLQLGPRQELS